jgi:hypothetical protein
LDAGPVTGTVAGLSFVAADAISVWSQETTSGAVPAGVLVALTSFTGACGFAATGAPPSNGAVVALAVPKGAAGTYAIGGVQALVSYSAQYGNQCHTYVTQLTYGTSDTWTKAAVFQEAINGELTLDTVSFTTVTGSVDAVFSSGGHLTGTFTAPNCAAQGPLLDCSTDGGELDGEAGIACGGDAAGSADGVTPSCAPNQDD